MSPPYLISPIFTLFGTIFFVGTVWAQTSPKSIAQQGDPARWYQEDRTPRELLESSMKEAAAALKEAIAVCPKKSSEARKLCIREARSIYEQDVKQAQQKHQ